MCSTVDVSSMNDPHVVSLKYNLESPDKTVMYVDPSPREFDTENFTARLAPDGDLHVLTVTMKEHVHYATAQGAKDAVQDFLTTWELHGALQRGRREFTFTFVCPTIIDRTPSPGALGDVLLAASGTVRSTGGVTQMTVGRRYPEPPPATFAELPNVETLWNRYENHLRNREPLPAMGYFSLTVIETLYGGQSKPISGARKPPPKRSAAAKALNIDVEVLSKLGQLTTERGDKTMARKQEANTSFQALTGEEAAWIRAVLTEIMRRVANPANAATLLTVADLPPL
jgi:hypothetical protein